jgi:hypothetical protein
MYNFLYKKMKYLIAFFTLFGLWESTTMVLRSIIGRTENDNIFPLIGVVFSIIVALFASSVIEHYYNKNKNG